MKFLIKQYLSNFEIIPMLFSMRYLSLAFYMLIALNPNEFKFDELFWGTSILLFSIIHEVNLLLHFFIMLFEFVSMFGNDFLQELGYC